MQPWFYPVVKYCFNAICFTRFIFVNSVIVSSIISCNDLYQDFIIMYVWYFVSRNSISVLGAIWPSLSPYTVINPILLTYSCPFCSGANSCSCWVVLICPLDMAVTEAPSVSTDFLFHFYGHYLSLHNFLLSFLLRKTRPSWVAIYPPATNSRTNTLHPAPKTET